MFRKGTTVAALCALSATQGLADFSYEQNSKVTGGMMAGMMKVAGVFSKTAREGFRSTILVKGDRMAMINGDRITVIDVGRETMTDIDLQKKQYATITFADMQRAMAALQQKMSKDKADAPEFTLKADVKNTGATRTINGFDTKETILTIDMEGTDKKSGQKMNMIVSTDMWVAPNMPGYDEVRAFYTKMAEKMSAFSPGSSFLGAMAAQQPGMSKGFAEAAKEASKIEGVPVVQITRMRAAGAGMPSEAEMAQAQQQQQQQPPVPSAGQVAEGAAIGAAAGRMGRLGGLAGGLGGFGRRKKQAEEQPAPAAQQQQQQQPQQQANAAPAGTMVELTTEMSAFSSGAVDGSKFEVPAGFKQVEHDLAKQAN